jgi:hypothetical protein
LASLKTYQACSAASITACLACSSSVRVTAVVVGAGIVVSATDATVLGAPVVVGGRIVDGAVLATAALVAGGSAPSPPPQADNPDKSATAAAVHARVLKLCFFNLGDLHRESVRWDSIVVATVWGARTPERKGRARFHA